jgi:hypothetical protein
MNKKTIILFSLVIALGVCFWLIFSQKDIFNNQTNTNQNNNDAQTVRFVINSETKFINTLWSTPSNVKPGEGFAPVETPTQGSIDDLVVGINILNLKSKENLFGTEKATAIEINYVTYDFGKK